MNIWRRSWWYRLYIIVGLPAVIALSVLAMLSADPREPSMLPIIAPVLVWITGLLILQWIFLLRRGVSRDAPEGEHAPAGAAAPPLDREVLRAALALGDGEENPGARARAAPTPQPFAVRAFAFITAFALAALGGSALYVTGAVDATIEPFGAGGPGIPVTVLPALALMLIGVLRLPRQLRRAVEVSDACGWATSGCGSRTFPPPVPTGWSSARPSTRESGTGAPFGSSKRCEPRPYTSRSPCRRSRRASASSPSCPSPARRLPSGGRSES